ncbi:starch phosphorylase isoform 1 [Galdieria sulphuraria]|uniref:Alpha-1,4 glucan phosphorylase n=1 Tax=Galdieria sulphuraria TaxID=130081 RepID=M2XAV7_GALSU|nr:starch phosphorylase isoform 1 [Galdieria sulphuraria]EME27027.1 starch phosphorylase isoform 1 [Galdieria sulphuraria]|eukprot:XP_005703547.1 starch phosphorylase isoform 1 [Galdieria sulphuraria]
MDKNKRTLSFQDLAKGTISPSESRFLYSVSGTTSPQDWKTIEEDEQLRRKSLLYSLMSQYLSRDVASIERYIVDHVEHTLARTRFNFDKFDAYLATALSVRDRLIESWNDTQQYFTEAGVKRAYYLSMEFLMGRQLQNALINLGIHDQYREALKELGFDLSTLEDEEPEPGLGNGGLGRLAACYMDSLATLNYPVWGYGIRYQYGMFEQKIKDGNQIEIPDFWLAKGNPWEMQRLDVTYPVQFYGNVIVTNKDGKLQVHWEGGQMVRAIAYDIPVPGFDTYNVLNLRLWSSSPPEEFDLEAFNRGDYFSSIGEKQMAEKLTSVLYPNDSTEAGKELRLKQQYFFVSATLQDIMRRFKKLQLPIQQLVNKAAIQLNDTHPTIAIPELLRLLIDKEGLGWEEAWDLTVQTFSYTNHTVLPEALEKWPVPLMERLLPRHMQIIYEINRRHLECVSQMFPNDEQILENVSLIEDGFPKMVRMASLAVVGSHRVNGVAALHSELVKKQLFPHFAVMTPDKFLNITNGVTPRRWILEANPALSSVFTRWLETDDWITDTRLLSQLEQFQESDDFLRQIEEAKRFNKQQLALRISQLFGFQVDSNALFDIQVKRIHEYKRQLLNILGVIHRYLFIKQSDTEQRKSIVPRVVVFAGKAAASYAQAKRIIRLINGVCSVVNNDPSIGDLLKVFFLPNYNVSLAEEIIPASDISQHISTAGMEASGTSNMKFVMNGGLILGTMDGANIEILENIGKENIFIFGLNSDQVLDARKRNEEFQLDPRLEKVKQEIANGTFCNQKVAEPILSCLIPKNDFYMIGRDFPSYLEAQDAIDQAFKNRKGWIKKTVCAMARVYYFSSDRAVEQYAQKIWNIEPAPFIPSTISFKD